MHWTDCLTNEDGQMLAWVVVAMVFGLLVVGGFLAFANSSLLVTEKTAEHTLAYYAADAGISTVVKDLLEGVDALAPGYTPPTLTVNDYTATVSIITPSATAPTMPGYFDPGASGGLASLASMSHYTFQMNSVQPDAYIHVNWAFSPSDKEWELSLYQGPGTGGTLIAQDNGGSSPGVLVVNDGGITGGTYTLDFYNSSDETLSSAIFTNTGGAGYTWVYGNVHKDYVVTSTTSLSTITAYLRQLPGPTAPTTGQTVSIEAWQGP